jgi:phosphonate transport system substrate-binding protein
VLAALAFAVLALQVAPAQEACPRGQLDTLYCDRDGDMVADLPTDSRQWLDPNPIVFAYTPVEDPAIYADIWKPFLDHLARVTGRQVRFFTVDSYAAQVEAMRAGRLHLAGISTGPTPFAVNLAGYVPFAIMGSEDGTFGYTLQVYVRKDSGINTMADLKGRRVAHTTPTSNSGHMAPMAVFPEFGINPGEDYELIFSGGHDASILGVAAGDYDAAPVASEVVDRVAARGLYNPDDLKIIWESAPFPTTSYGHAHNLHPDLVAKIKEAFFTFDFVGTALGEEFFGVTKFVPINYKDDWTVIRATQAFLGIEYTRAQLLELR